LAPEDVCVIAPWQGDYGVPLNVMAPVPGLEPAVQASLLADMVADFTDDFSVRMATVFRPLCLALFDLAEQGELGSLLDILALLTDVSLAARLAARVRDPEVRQFLLRTLWTPALARTRESLRYRISELVALPNMRALLCSARGSIDASALLNSRLTLVDLSAPRMGMAGPSLFVGRYVFLLLASAIYRQSPHGDDHPSWVFVDEWQLLARHLAQSFGDLLSLARSRNVALVLANQHPGQVREASHVLWESVQENMAWRALFHPGREALREIEAYIPVTGRVIDPKNPSRLLSPQAERAAIEGVLSRLPPRRAVIVNERGTDPLSVVTTMTLPVARARAAWAALPEAEKVRWRRGRYGVPLHELGPRPLDPPPLPTEAENSVPTQVPRFGKTRFPGRAGGLRPTLPQEDE
ncbi:MAG: hypothetical protein ACOZNI_12055, partial [Myxococcota bacterium]